MRALLSNFAGSIVLITHSGLGIAGSTVAIAKGVGNVEQHKWDESVRKHPHGCSRVVHPNENVGGHRPKTGVVDSKDPV